MARIVKKSAPNCWRALMWYTGTFVGGVATFGLPKIE